MSPHPASAPAAPAADAIPVTWADPARAQAFARWLASTAQRNGLQPDSLCLASADASFRRYLRVSAADGTRRIVMDAPPAHENCRPFVQVATLMAEADLHVPRVIDWDEAQGFMLLTDLGTHTVMQALDASQPQAAQAWYIAALAPLVRWQAASRPDAALPAYDATLLQRELALFPDWYVQRHKGMALTDAQRQTLQRTFDQIVAHNLAAPTVYVHRDYMMRNLMQPTVPGGPLGVLDFQDAVMGPITYDIASLLRDAFISWDEDFVLDIAVRYWQLARQAGLPVDADFGAFYRALEWMGLQRHLKVAGIFARLTLRDGKPRYLADTPRFIGYIRATCARYRELTPLLRLIDAIEGIQPQALFTYGRA